MEPDINNVEQTIGLFLLIMKYIITGIIIGRIANYIGEFINFTGFFHWIIKRIKDNRMRNRK